MSKQETKRSGVAWQSLEASKERQGGTSLVPKYGQSRLITAFGMTWRDLGGQPSCVNSALRPKGWMCNKFKST